MKRYDVKLDEESFIIAQEYAKEQDMPITKIVRQIIINSKNNSKNLLSVDECRFLYNIVNSFQIRTLDNAARHDMVLSVVSKNFRDVWIMETADELNMMQEIKRKLKDRRG